ncbi:hypothetical protein [Metabacillus sediminilitoris]|nr:hypothetical protein [Metabacillus sediminilitoris]
MYVLVKVIESGLLSEIAQTVVQSGIDMSTIPTFSLLKQALESIE